MFQGEKSLVLKRRVPKDAEEMRRKKDEEEQRKKEEREVEEELIQNIQQNRYRIWFYQIMGTPLGPITPEELLELARKGTINTETLIRKGDSGDWIPAEKVSGLFSR